jgi:hypothetical protein
MRRPLQHVSNVPKGDSCAGANGAARGAAPLPHSTSRIPFDLDWGVAGKRGHPNGDAGVLADWFAKDLHHQVRESVYHFWLISKSLGRVDRANNFDDAFNAVQASKRDTLAKKSNPAYRAAWSPCCGSIRQRSIGAP